MVMDGEPAPETAIRLNRYQDPIRRLDDPHHPAGHDRAARRVRRELHPYPQTF